MRSLSISLKYQFFFKMGDKESDVVVLITSCFSRSAGGFSSFPMRLYERSRELLSNFLKWTSNYNIFAAARAIKYISWPNKLFSSLLYVCVCLGRFTVSADCI